MRLFRIPIIFPFFRTNTGVKPFKCHWPDCGKSFAQLSNLKSHVARHTPGRPKGRKSSAKKQTTPVAEVSRLFNVILYS